MENGIWTIAPCAHADVRRLSAALGVSEVTATVLARRGLGDAGEARAFLDGGLPEHDLFSLGDMREAVAAIVRAVAAVRVSASTATTTPTESAPPPSARSSCASS